MGRNPRKPDRNNDCEEQATFRGRIKSEVSAMSNVMVTDYLQSLAEVLRIRHEPGVFVSFIEPGTAAYFSGALLPVHSVALPILDMYVIPLSLHGYHHLILLVSHCTVQA